MSSLGFKARVGSALFTFCGGECTVHSPRSISGATPANLLAAGIVASHFPTCISSGGSWLRFKRAITQTKDECATIVPATRFHSVTFHNKGYASFRSILFFMFAKSNLPFFEDIHLKFYYLLNYQVDRVQLIAPLTNPS